MLKTLLITGHLIGLFVISLFISNEVTIIDNFPTNAKVGESYMVKATISKGSIEGFAKYQIQAPSGMSIKPVELNGASFTFKDGKAKFIWMNIPNTPEFEITYKVSIDKAKTGQELEVTSKFLYLLENERKVYQGQDHRVRIVSDDEIVDNSSSNNASSSSSSTLNSDVSATRTITPEGDNKYLVEITINKLGVKGFAKIQDIVPEGIIATEVSNQEAIFTQVGEKIKLVWFDIPKKMDLVVSYQLIVPPDHTTDFSVEGKFHYMAGSDLKKVDIPADMIKLSGAIASTNTAQSDNSTTQFTETTSDDVSNSFTENSDATAQDNSGITNDNMSNSESNSYTNTSDVDNTSNSTDTYSSDYNRVSDATDNNSTDANNSLSDTMENLNATNSSSSYSDATTETSSNSNEANQTETYNDNTTTNDTYTNDSYTNDTYSNNTENTNDSYTNDSYTNDSYSNDSYTDNASNTNVAEPESTAVAVNEYYKDEVIEEDNSISNISNFSDPDTGVTYRVQIMAGKNIVGKSYLAKRHNFTSKFTIENHQGWVKYTTGSYDNYKSARDSRNVVTNNYNFDGPFVSAYNDGERITVQEALMITKQQWYN